MLHDRYGSRRWCIRHRVPCVLRAEVVASRAIVRAADEHAALQVISTVCEEDLRRLGFRSGHARKLMLHLSTLYAFVAAACH